MGFGALISVVTSLLKCENETDACYLTYRIDFSVQIKGLYRRGPYSKSNAKTVNWVDACNPLSMRRRRLLDSVLLEGSELLRCVLNVRFFFGRRNIHVVGSKV